MLDGGTDVRCEHQCKQQWTEMATDVYILYNYVLCAVSVVLLLFWRVLWAPTMLTTQSSLLVTKFKIEPVFRWKTRLLSSGWRKICIIRHALLLRNKAALQFKRSYYISSIANIGSTYKRYYKRYRLKPGDVSFPEYFASSFEAAPVCPHIFMSIPSKWLNEQAMDVHCFLNSIDRVFFLFFRGLAYFLLYAISSSARFSATLITASSTSGRTFNMSLFSKSWYWWIRAVTCPPVYAKIASVSRPYNFVARPKLCNLTQTQSHISSSTTGHTVLVLSPGVAKENPIPRTLKDWTARAREFVRRHFIWKAHKNTARCEHRCKMAGWM